jgi:hypothetical protein
MTHTLQSLKVKPQVYFTHQTQHRDSVRTLIRLVLVGQLASLTYHRGRTSLLLSALSPSVL